MARKYWIETTLQGLSEDEIVDLFSKYILILRVIVKQEGFICVVGLLNFRLKSTNF